MSSWSFSACKKAWESGSGNTFSASVSEIVVWEAPCMVHRFRVKLQVLELR